MCHFLVLLLTCTTAGHSTRPAHSPPGLCWSPPGAAAAATRTGASPCCCNRAGTLPAQVMLGNEMRWCGQKDVGFTTLIRANVRVRVTLLGHACLHVCASLSAFPLLATLPPPLLLLLLLLPGGWHGTPLQPQLWRLELMLPLLASPCFLLPALCLVRTAAALALAIDPLCVLLGTYMGIYIQVWQC